MAASPHLRHRHQAFFATGADAAWQPLRVADEVWSRGQVVERPRFAAVFLALVVAGRAVLRCDGVAEELAPGRVFGMFARRDHRLETAEDLHLRILVGGGAGLEAACLALAPRPPPVWRPPRPAAVEALLDELLEVAEEGGPQAAAVGAGGLRLLTALLAHAPARPPAGGAAATYAACRELLEREALAISTVAEAAERCGLDRAYLSRLCASHGGEAPGALLLRIKMERAARELAAGSTVADTARCCGYGSPDVFSRAFRRHFGRRPDAWRRQLA